MNAHGAPAAQLLEQIFEGSLDAIVSIDPAGRITSWNPAATALYGYAMDEALGMPMDRLLPAGAGAEIVQRALRGKEVGHRECTRVRRDGSMVVVGETLSPLRGRAGEIVGATAVSHDITARSALDAELRSMAQRLEENNRHLEQSNQELEQFAYVASHDLQEPLRAVAGMVGLLARRYRGAMGDEADEFIALAVDGCTRMRAMIEDLLMFSRAGRVELRISEVDANSSVHRVIRAMEPQREEAGAEIVVDPMPSLRTDASQLELVVQHLLSNALKFRRPDVPPVIQIRGERVGDSWRCTVSDNGIGIDARHTDRIFRMFQRLHPADRYPGTGIGLAVTRKVVERLGGTLGVESNDRGGSTFWFTVRYWQKDGDDDET